jgi:hypothetical protein
MNPMKRFVPSLLVLVIVSIFSMHSVRLWSQRSELVAKEREQLEQNVSVQAAENGPKKPNLSLWVPDQELQVWDPVNPNVNPVPWRVYSSSDDSPRGRAEFRHLAVGKRVCVEGLAWGHDVHTDLPKSRVVFEGGTVLVKGVNFNKAEVRGRIVRVVGTLLIESMPHSGFERQFPRYYCIDAEAFEIIEQATAPQVVTQPKHD